MTKEETLYLTIGKKMPIAEQSLLFGIPCFKIDEKVFICFYQNKMAFKLPPALHFQTLILNGSQLFYPSTKTRPLKEWVLVTFEFSEIWSNLAEEAMKYTIKTSNTNVIPKLKSDKLGILH